MVGRRVVALVALVSFVAAVVVAVVEVAREFPRGLVVVALLVGCAAAAWQALVRRSRVPHALVGGVVLMLDAAVVVELTGDRVGMGLVAVALLLLALDRGVDRNEMVGALDALVTEASARVDLAEVNGRAFVNNVSLGL